MWESYMEESNRQTTPNNLDLDPPSPQPHQRNLMGHYTPTFDRPGINSCSPVEGFGPKKLN